MINCLAISAGAIAGAVVGSVLGLIFFILLVAFILFMILFFRPPSVYKVNAITRKMMGPELDNLNKFIAEHNAILKQKDCEEVEIKSQDGLTLRAYYYSCGQPTDKVVLLSHGFKSTCYNTYGPQALFYLDNGFDVYMISQRAHFRSEGKFSSFSIKEGEDVARWAHFIAERNPECKIIMHGNSMGATSVMEATALDLPENVKCAIADCGFTSATDELFFQMTTMFHLPACVAKPLLKIVAGYCKLVAGFDLYGNSAIESVKSAKVPIMFVHGTADNTVPVDHSKRNHDACVSEKKLLIYEGAGHGQSYLKYGEEYGKETIAFAEKYM